MVVMMMVVGVIVVMVIVRTMVIIGCGWSRAADCDYADNTHYCSDLP